MVMSADGGSGAASSVPFKGLVSEAGAAILGTEVVFAAIVKVRVVMVNSQDSMVAQDISRDDTEPAQARAPDTACGVLTWLDDDGDGHDVIVVVEDRRGRAFRRRSHRRLAALSLVIMSLGLETGHGLTKQAK